MCHSAFLYQVLRPHYTLSGKDAFKHCHWRHINSYFIITIIIIPHVLANIFQTLPTRDFLFQQLFCNQVEKFFHRGPHPRNNWILSIWLISLRKQPMFHNVAIWAFAKRHLSNECRNSILMTCHYPDQGRDTSSVWNFCARYSDIILWGLKGDFTRHQLFSQAIVWSILLLNWMNWIMLSFNREISEITPFFLRPAPQGLWHFHLHLLL